jgi:hypothetical protein
MNPITKPPASEPAGRLETAGDLRQARQDLDADVGQVNCLKALHHEPVQARGENK